MTDKADDKTPPSLLGPPDKPPPADYSAPTPWTRWRPPWEPLPKRSRGRPKKDLPEIVRDKDGAPVEGVRPGNLLERPEHVTVETVLRQKARIKARQRKR
jgi:hypothetical protein